MRAQVDAEITPEMIEGGARAIMSQIGGADLGGWFSADELARAVFLAMTKWPCADDVALGEQLAHLSSGRLAMPMSSIKRIIRNTVTAELQDGRVVDILVPFSAPDEVPAAGQRL